MFRFIFCLFFSFLLISPVFSQSQPPTPLPPHLYPPHPQQSEEEKKIVEPPPTRLVWEIRGDRPPNKNILFIIDTSGSMDGKQVQSAIKMAMSIAEAPVDDLQIALVSFGSSTNRWAGTTDIDPNTGKDMSRNRWSVMPSQDNLTVAYNWLQANRDSGGTSILPAINHAFRSCLGGKENEKVKELSIFIISDGEFGNYSLVKKTIELHQKRRIDAKLPLVSLGFIGVDVPRSYNLKIKNLIGEPLQAQGQDPLEPYLPTIGWRPVLGSLGYCRIEYIIPKKKEDDD